MFECSAAAVPASMSSRAMRPLVAFIAITVVGPLFGVAEAASPQAAKASVPAYKVGSTFKECDQCSDMVVVPAGEFSMGITTEESKREPETDEFTGWQQPVHAVKVESFAIAKYAVTRAQFAAFAAETGYDTTTCVVTTWNGKVSGHEAIASAGWRKPGFAQTDRDPVVCVNWTDAVMYVNWLAAKTRKPYRLPTEAEMEYATRAGTTTTRYWGDDPLQQCKYANGADLAAQKVFPGWNSTIDFGNGHVVACDDSYIQTAPVGSFQPNAWGLYDMLGNAFVWTADCWHPNYVGAPTDGSAWMDQKCDQHVIRGGSWFFHPGAVHSSFRHPVRDNRDDFIGIRVARSLQ